MHDAIARAAISLATVALAPVVLWAVNRLLGPSPVETARLDALDAKIERTRERIAVAHGKHKDAYKSWKVSDL
jgi:hypothetical protein